MQSEVMRFKSKITSLAKSAGKRIGLNIRRFKSVPYEYLLDMPRYKECRVELSGQPFKIADPASFFYSYQEIFVRQLYKFNTQVKEPFIIDLGSNYGTSIVFFKTIYPFSKIKAVEADPKIFEYLEWNLSQRGYDDVELVNKAISNEKPSIKFYSDGADGGSIHPDIESRRAIVVETITLDELIDRPIDFLKIDIEGAETEAICTSNKLEQVSNLFVEYHSFNDTAQSLHLILEKLAMNGFRYFLHDQFCSPRPLSYKKTQNGMDLTINIFATR